MGIYPLSGSFFFQPEQSLKDVCNAPENASGVYIVFSANNEEDVIYIGSSGKMKQNGKLSTRKGGIKRRIVHGNQFGEKRYKIWRTQMEVDGISMLKISWWITHDEKNFNHIPKYSEALLLQRYYEEYGELPLWNKEF